MRVKAKYRVSLFPDIEFVTYQGKSYQGVVYFQKLYEQEVLTLINNSSFWNRIKIVKLSLNHKTMFKKILMNVLETYNNQNYTQQPIAEDLMDLSKVTIVKNFLKAGSMRDNTIWNIDYQQIVRGVEHSANTTKQPSFSDVTKCGITTKDKV